MILSDSCHTVMLYLSNVFHDAGCVGPIAKLIYALSMLRVLTALLPITFRYCPFAYALFASALWEANNTLFLALHSCGLWLNG